MRNSFTNFIALMLVVGGVFTTYTLASTFMTRNLDDSASAAATKPGEVFSLKAWKLTLPINDAQEIKQPLLDIYDTEHFHLNIPKDAIVFMSPAGGDTTGGSEYARSELRELAGLPLSITSDCLKKDDKACWSSSIGYHTMTIDQKVTHLPSSTPNVVIGQIHDGDNALNNNNGDDVVVFRLEGKKLFINADGSADDFVLTNNYNLGERFTVTFEVENNKTRYYYNGNPVKKADGSVVELNRTYRDAYFKAGMYVQSNEKNGAYGENEIYNVMVCHASSKATAGTECGANASTPTPNPTTPTPTPVVTPTPTPTVKPTNTPKPTATPTPTPGPQGKVSNLVVTSPKDSQIKATWSKYSGASKYRVYVAIDQPTNFKEEKSTSSTSFNDDDFKSCRNYFFRVDAFDSKGKKIASSDIAGVQAKGGSDGCN